MYDYGETLNGAAEGGIEATGAQELAKDALVNQQPLPPALEVAELVLPSSEGFAKEEEAAPAFVGLGEQIASSRTGDFVESIGLPRQSAPWIIGALAVACLMWRGR